jgi:hypothetical protein
LWIDYICWFFTRNWCASALTFFHLVVLLHFTLKKNFFHCYFYLTLWYLGLGRKHWIVYFIGCDVVAIRGFAWACWAVIRAVRNIVIHWRITRVRKANISRSDYVLAVFFVVPCIAFYSFSSDSQLLSF